jgi:hypothetical protein
LRYPKGRRRGDRINRARADWAATRSAGRDPYRTLTFHIDPEAAEQVWAVSDTGALIETYWLPGFEAGRRRNASVPAGEIVVSDGDVVPVPQGANLRIQGYLVCLRPDRLYVLSAESG